MRIILNVESLMKPSGGIGRYTKHLLAGLLNSEEISHVHCFTGYGWVDGEEFLSSINSHVYSPDEPSASFLSNLRKLARSIPFFYQAYVFYRAIAFKKGAKTYKNAIYHEPNFILKPFDGKSVATVHDISHMHLPEYHPKERVDYMNKNFSETLSRASHILTDSEFVKNELVEILGVEANRISSVALGVDSVFFPRSNDELAPVLSKYNLIPGSYLLSLSTLEPRKNILQILDSYMGLSKTLRNKYPLVIAGGDGWNNREIKNKIKQLENEGCIKSIGYTSDNDLPFLIAGARSFIFIPFYEGFGLPPLEAMASGVSILTSNVSSLPEVVADCGLMVEPDDNEAIVFNLEKLLTDEEWRKKAIMMGLERSKQYNWDKCVADTIKIYKKIGKL